MKIYICLQENQIIRKELFYNAMITDVKKKRLSVKPNMMTGNFSNYQNVVVE